MRRHLGSLTLLLAAVGAVVCFKTLGSPAGARGHFTDDPPPVADYQQACNSDPASARCALLHGAMRARALEALDLAAAARDQRNVGAVLGFFDLADEPEIHEAAARVVAAFPRNQAAIERARPLLFGDHTASQRAGARLLGRSTDPTDRHLAAQWEQNHRGPAPSSPYLRQPAQPDPARLRFSRYPGATRWNPGDGPMTIGLATTDPLQRVVDFYARATGAAPVDAAVWRRRLDDHRRAQGKAVQAELPDLRQDADYLEAQRLAKEYQRTRDQAFLKQLEAVSRRLEEKGRQVQERVQTAQARTAAGLLESYALPGQNNESPARTARFLVAEQRGARVVRMVVVYREETLGKTVVQLVWDPAAYPVAPPR
jgi:hypothetical protein